LNVNYAGYDVGCSDVVDVNTIRHNSKKMSKNEKETSCKEENSV
jgi:hypothetical protein